MDEQKSLGDLKHELEVKVCLQFTLKILFSVLHWCDLPFLLIRFSQVALLNTKLTIAEEREREQYGIAKEKISELSNAKQKICDLEVDLKKSLKGQELLEQQVNDMKKKLNLAKNAGLEKIDLEEQVETQIKQRENLFLYYVVTLSLSYLLF